MLTMDLLDNIQPDGGRQDGREREGGRRKRWGEPRACLTEEVQGLIATCPSRGGDCQRLELKTSHAASQAPPGPCSNVVYRQHIDVLSSSCPPESIHRTPRPWTTSTRPRPRSCPGHVGRCSLGARECTSAAWGAAPSTLTRSLTDRVAETLRSRHRVN